MFNFSCKFAISDIHLRSVSEHSWVAVLSRLMHSVVWYVSCFLFKLQNLVYLGMCFIPSYLLSQKCN
jgi:hypothetical protein